ncbi:hypothetical protein [Aeromonas sp. MdU4]|uniref:hypothetical protein n=1 Tax=Aeromonas sp. MdU4 TaxID=3342819 RepID=UPI0035B9E73E
MNCNGIAMLVATFLLSSQLSFAQQVGNVSVPDAVQNKDEILRGYGQELDSIKKSQRETLLLRQQLEAEKLRSELSKLRGEQDNSGIPYVLALTGVGKQRMALVGVNGVGEVRVRTGDTLPGGWVITSISDRSVTANQADGSNHVVLPFVVSAKFNG